MVTSVVGPQVSEASVCSAARRQALTSPIALRGNGGSALSGSPACANAFFTSATLIACGAFPPPPQPASTATAKRRAASFIGVTLQRGAEEQRSLAPVLGN